MRLLTLLVVGSTLFETHATNTSSQPTAILCEEVDFENRLDDQKILTTETGVFDIAPMLADPTCLPDVAVDSFSCSVLNGQEVGH